MSSLTTPLFQHTKRTEWGAAILAWERGDKRGYQFEDGKMRVFKRGFYHFLEPVQGAAQLDTSRVDRLKAHLEHTQSQPSRSKAPKTRTYELDDQFSVFKRTYTRGFRGDIWTTKLRGTDLPASKHRKGHRDPVIARAQELLKTEDLASRDAAELVDELGVLLGSTSTVSPKHAKAMREYTPERAAKLVAALSELLSPEAEGIFIDRFRAYISILQGKQRTPVPWQLASAILALYDPNQFAWIIPSTFRRQSDLSTFLTKHPEPTAYQAMLRVLGNHREALVKRKLDPRDLFDVVDFHRETLRPSAIKQM